MVQMTQPETARYGASRTALRLRVHRVAADLTQEELAKRSGVSRKTIGRCEKGQRPSRLTALALARALNVEIEALFPDVGGSRS